MQSEGKNISIFCNLPALVPPLIPGCDSWQERKKP
jgi:hypothetical protein